MGPVTDRRSQGGRLGDRGLGSLRGPSQAGSLRHVNEIGPTPCERVGPGLIRWSGLSVGAGALERVGDPGGDVRAAPNFRRIGQELLVVVVHELVGRIETHG